MSLPIFSTASTPNPAQTTTDTTTSPTTTSTSSTDTSTSQPTTTSTTTSTTSGTTTSTTTTSSIPTSTTSTTTTSSSTTSTSTTAPSTTSTTALPTSSSSSTVVFTSNGQVITSTAVVIVSPTGSAGTANDSNSSNSKGFFQNTGAVAGVFTVVGLVALVLFIAIITNAVRRRRAKKLDREIAEAAAEAAGTAPAFSDDDYYPDDRLGKAPAGDLRSMNTGYSDTTHGTFAQPPMSHHGASESYNMAELSSYEYGPAAGAAGIGAMGVNRGRSIGGGGGQSAPYNAFAGPGMPNPYEDPANAYAQQQSLRYRQRGPGAGPQEMDLLDAAGLAGGAAAGYAVAHQTYGNGGTLNRNPSLGPSSATSPSDYSSYGAHPQMPMQQGYQQDYNPYQSNQYNHAAYQPGPPQGYAPQAAYAAAGTGPSHSQSQPSAAEMRSSPTRPLSTVSAADPYGGYVDDSGSLPRYSSPSPQVGVHAASPPPEKLLGGNFASPPASSEGHDQEQEENRMNYQDEDDYAYEPKRVLKVANE